MDIFLQVILAVVQFALIISIFGAIFTFSRGIKNKFFNFKTVLILALTFFILVGIDMKVNPNDYLPVPGSLEYKLNAKSLPIVK